MKHNNILSSLLLLMGAGITLGSFSNVVSAQEVRLYPGKADVYFSTGNRLPPIKREDLDDLGKQIYDSIVKEGRSFTYDEKKNAYLGPRSARIYSPTVAFHSSNLNQYLRYQAGLDPKLRELIILNAGWQMNAQFEWHAHEGIAHEVGLAQEVIDIVKYDKPVPANLAEKEAVIINLSRELLRGDHRVSSETYARAQALFGIKQLVEIVALLGSYVSTAIILNTFDQQLPPGQTSSLPKRSD